MQILHIVGCLLSCIRKFVRVYSFKRLIAKFRFLSGLDAYVSCSCWLKLALWFVFMETGNSNEHSARLLRKLAITQMCMTATICAALIFACYLIFYKLPPSGAKGLDAPEELFKRQFESYLAAKVAGEGNEEPHDGQEWGGPSYNSNNLLDGRRLGAIKIISFFIHHNKSPMELEVIYERLIQAVDANGNRFPQTVRGQCFFKLLSHRGSGNKQNGGGGPRLSTQRILKEDPIHGAIYMQN